jgi:hypothetical protein
LVHSSNHFKRRPTRPYSYPTSRRLAPGRNSLLATFRQDRFGSDAHNWRRLFVSTGCVLIMFLIGVLGWLVHMNANTPQQLVADVPAPPIAPADMPALVDAADALPPLVLVKAAEETSAAAVVPRLLVTPMPAAAPVLVEEARTKPVPRFRLANYAQAPAARPKKRRVAPSVETEESDNDVRVLQALIDFSSGGAAPSAEAGKSGKLCTDAAGQGRKCASRAVNLLHVMRKSTD